jgi:HEAT repeat protein
VRALENRIEDIPFVFDDDEGLAVIERTVRKGDPAHVLFALQLMERGNPDRVGPLVMGVLDHESPQVRAYALNVLRRVGPPGALDAVRARLQTEPEPRVRGAALRCLADLAGAGAQEELVSHLEHPAPEVRQGAVVGLVWLGADFARKYVYERSRSRSSERRTWAARVIAEAGYEGFERPLRRLLRDPDPDVRRTALATAGVLGEHELWPALMRGLRQRALCGPSANAFVTIGAEAVPFLERSFTDDVPPDLGVRLVRVLGRIQGEAATKLLARRLAFPVETVRHEVLDALRQCGYVAQGAEATRVREQIEREAGSAALTLAWLRDLDEDASLDLLRGALEAEVARSRERVFLLLSFVYDAQAILRAREHRADPSREKRAYALEVLDVTLETDLRRRVLPLLDDAPDKSARLAEWFPHPPVPSSRRLVEILERDPEWATPWTQACAMHVAAQSIGIGVREKVEAVVSGETTALVRETATSAIERLDALASGAVRVETERRRMNTIEKVITLKAVQMFARTSEDVLADIASVLEEMDLEAGHLIFDKGAVGDSMYIIVEGRVRVFDGERTIVELGQRDIFGELALLDPEPRFASIETLEPTRLLRLDREAFLELMAGNIEIVRGILHVLCQRLRRTVKKDGPYMDEPESGADGHEVT